MHPTIEEILRWKVGEPVRAAVQLRWQQELRALDENLARLQTQVELMARVEQTQKASKAVSR